MTTTTEPLQWADASRTPYPHPCLRSGRGDIEFRIYRTPPGSGCGPWRLLVFVGERLTYSVNVPDLLTGQDLADVYAATRGETA